MTLNLTLTRTLSLITCVITAGITTSAPNRFKFPSNDRSLKVADADVITLLIEKISSHSSDNWTPLFIIRKGDAGRGCVPPTPWINTQRW